MPPQQPDRLLDLVDDGLDFSAHGRDLVVQHFKCNAFVIARSTATKQSSDRDALHTTLDCFASLRSQ
jgi:hypothetical protein